MSDDWFVSENVRQDMSDVLALVSFAPCQAGYRERREGDSSEELCIPCPPGSSTDGWEDSTQCTPCPPGYVSLAGSATCSPCPVGTHAAEAGQTECLPCTFTTYQRFTGQSVCTGCESNQYLRRPPDSNKSLCESCPAVGLTCAVITESAEAVVAAALIAQPASYLLIDSRSGLVTSVPCAGLACIDGAQCVEAAVWGGAAVQSIPVTLTTVLNCCGPNRKPAVDAQAGLNVLCAECMDGFSSVRGRCISCPSTQWLPLLAVLVCALLLVYLLHLLSSASGLEGSAVLPIVVYFCQMSALFASGSLPLIASFLNLDLLGDGAGGSSDYGLGNTSWCIIPLTEYEKIALRLLSPLLAIALLGLLLLGQVAARLWKAQCARSRWAGSRGERPRRWAGQLMHRWSHRELPLARLVRGDKQRDDNKAQPLLEAADQQLPVQGGTSLRHGAAADTDVTSRAQGRHSDPACPADEVEGGALSSRILIPYRHTLQRLALFSYNSISSTGLAFFHARQVGELGERLWAYPAIDTSERLYGLLRPVVAVGLVAVALLGPAALALHLYRLRRRRETSLESAGVAMMAMYRPGYWWFSVYVLARRLLLIVLFTFVPAPLLYSVLTAVNVAVLCLQLDQRPYHRAADNNLEAMTLAALALQTMMLSAFPAAETRPAWLSAALWLLSPLLTLAIVVQQLLVRLFAVWERWHRQQAGKAVEAE